MGFGVSGCSPAMMSIGEGGQCRRC